VAKTGIMKIPIKIKKSLFLIILFLVTIWFIHKNIFVEFVFFGFKEINLFYYVFLMLIILSLSWKIIGKWVIIPIFISILLFTLSYSLSRTIARRLDNFNRNKVESFFSNKENCKKENWLLIYHGIIPSIYHFDATEEITIYGIFGNFEIYHLKTGEWTEHD
jgi:hypothetical protein